MGAGGWRGSGIGMLSRRRLMGVAQLPALELRGSGAESELPAMGDFCNFSKKNAFLCILFRPK